jgi:predicted metal-dependent hydrolase
MTTERSHMTVQGIWVEVVRKDIRNLHFSVHPPDGWVRVAAPLAVSDEAVRLAVIGRLAWIRRRQAILKEQPRESRREMVTGESHYYLGRRHRLCVIPHDGPGRVELRGASHIDLYARADSTAEQREEILQRWYRSQLRRIAAPMFPKWEMLLGVMVDFWGIKLMRTKWGSCKADRHRIWLNLELVKTPVACIEYIVVHEMMHLLVQKHGEEFTRSMDRYLPQWRANSSRLDRAVLTHHPLEA